MKPHKRRITRMKKHSTGMASVSPWLRDARKYAIAVTGSHRQTEGDRPLQPLGHTNPYRGVDWSNEAKLLAATPHKD
jgi:hypothetical protein